jgi:outer membrane protein TolC
MHSPQVRVMADTPLIRRTLIDQAVAKFDFKSFVETKFTDTSDPVGNDLLTGGPPRYLNQNWNLTAGLQQTNTFGGEIEASQRFGWEDSNSIFFQPPRQGTAKLVLNVTQPLLQGAGRPYNTSLIVLAEIDAQIARDELAADLQDYLFELQETYWDLYLQRASLLQKCKLHDQAREILEELEARREVDVLGNQLARARAAVALREAAVIRARTSARNAESKLRAMIQDPELIAFDYSELIPVQRPQRVYLPANLQQTLTTALVYRPEVSKAADEIRAAARRAEVARKDLLPVLNAVLGAYVYGLQGEDDLAGAWRSQFTEGRPTYSAGLVFEWPFGNRAANAKLRQRQLELRRLTNALRVTVGNLRAEVEVAVREVETAHLEMLSKGEAVRAEEAEIHYLQERWRLLPGEDQVAGIVLDNLLTAQDRLNFAEYGFANAEVSYNLALVNLRRVTGTMLTCEDVEAVENGMVPHAGPPVHLPPAHVSAEPLMHQQTPPANMPPNVTIQDTSPHMGLPPVPAHSPQAPLQGPMHRAPQVMPQHGLPTQSVRYPAPSAPRSAIPSTIAPRPEPIEWPYPETADPGFGVDGG